MLYNADEIEFVYEKNMLCIARVNPRAVEDSEASTWEARDVDSATLSCK